MVQQRPNGRNTRDVGVKREQQCGYPKKVSVQFQRNIRFASLCYKTSNAVCVPRFWRTIWLRPNVGRVGTKSWEMVHTVHVT